MIVAAIRRGAVTRAGLLAACIVLIEWSRALVARQPQLTAAALVVGGVALVLVAAGMPPRRLGLGTSRPGLRVLGGFALGAVLLLPAAVRSGAVPLLAPGLVLAAVAVSIGEEVAFRGALYAALEEVGGAPLAIVGSTLAWTIAHVLSHPAEFLGAVATAGLVLALWRWAARDLVAPIIGHVIADVAL